MEKLEMKSYQCLKTVKAVAMRKEEAEKLLGREIKPAKDADNGEGYLVEYKDGYRSWSPKAAFEDGYKVCETWKDRLVIERHELVERIDKLGTALAQEGIIEKVGQSQYRMMCEQAAGMWLYDQALFARLVLANGVEE